MLPLATLAIIHKKNQPKLATSQRKNTGQFKNPAIFWQPARTCCLNMEIS